MHGHDCPSLSTDPEQSWIDRRRHPSMALVDGCIQGVAFNLLERARQLGISSSKNKSVEGPCLVNGRKPAGRLLNIYIFVLG